MICKIGPKNVTFMDFCTFFNYTEKYYVDDTNVLDMTSDFNYTEKYYGLLTICVSGTYFRTSEKCKNMRNSRITC